MPDADQRPDQRPEPRPEPLADRRHSMLARFVAIMKWMALVAVGVAVFAVLLVMAGEDGFHLHMMIATALGAGLTVLLAAALMTLVFLSSSSGHDDAARPASRADEDER